MALRAFCAGSRISFRSRKRARCTRPGHEGCVLCVLPRCGALPPPLAGEGWGGGMLAPIFADAGNPQPIFVRAPSLSLPRKRGRGRWSRWRVGNAS